MALIVKNIIRQFKHGDVVLDDPNPNMTPEEVKKLYSAKYPELTNAGIETPVTKNDKLVYSFNNKVGTKG